MKKKETSAWVTGAVLVALILPATLMLGAWMLFDVSDARRGWPAYYLALPKSVRDATSTVEECRPARLRWKGRDGLAQPYVLMRYGSRLPPHEVVPHHTAALAPLACQPDAERLAAEPRPHSHALRCEHADVMAVDMEVGSEGPCHEVTLVFLLND